MLASDLMRRLASTCPVVSVSIGNFGDKTTWIVTPSSSATPAQIAALPAAIQSIDVTVKAADEILESMPFSTIELAAMFLVVAGSPPAWATAIFNKAISTRKAAVGAGIPTGL